MKLEAAMKSRAAFAADGPLRAPGIELAPPPTRRGDPACLERAC
jgi:hypothetical protein